MQMVHDAFAEQLAKLFHYYGEVLAPDFGFQSSEGCFSWEQILPAKRELMVATARLVLMDLAKNYGAAPAEQSDCAARTQDAA